jgi:hypothetical protein
MDARRSLRVLCAAALLLCSAATYRTANFVVQAASDEVARQVGEAAERYRRELALLWLGKEFPDWSRPCPITVRVAPNLGAGGVTSFYFNGGEVYGWRMSVQGSLERVLDSVLPHEVNHTIFATHFRQPLPRWADEGACTTVEAESERNKQRRMLVEFLQSGRGIAFSQMYTMQDYPRDVLPLYAQGHSLASYLIEQGGRRKFIQYLEAGLREENWPAVTQRFYGFASLSALQNGWLDWVRQGSPPLQPGRTDILLAGNRDVQPQSPKVIYRGQSSDAPPAARAVTQAAATELATTTATATQAADMQHEPAWPGTVRADATQAAAMQGGAAAAGALVPLAGSSMAAAPAATHDAATAALAPAADSGTIYAGQMPPERHRSTGHPDAPAAVSSTTLPPKTGNPSGASHDGWHAPQRVAAAAAPSASTSLAGALQPRATSPAADLARRAGESDSSGGVVSSGLIETAPQHTQAVRPRDFERPAQVILEWTRPQRSRAAGGHDDGSVRQSSHEVHGADRILRR